AGRSLLALSRHEVREDKRFSVRRLRLLSLRGVFEARTRGGRRNSFAGALSSSCPALSICGDHDGSNSALLLAVCLCTSFCLFLSVCLSLFLFLSLPDPRPRPLSCLRGIKILFRQRRTIY
ncbi:unnamed protein product, partial [Scytosiphon promiscuus]